jgi:hypothetical protein
VESTLLGALQGRSGPLFWVSAVAVAAGVTALTVSLLVVGARLARARRRRLAAAAAAPARSPVALAARAEPAPAVPPTAAVLRAYQAQAGGAEASRDPESPLPETAAGVEPGRGGSATRLAPLLTRLRTAANRLEEAALAMESSAPAEAGHLCLKTGPDEVEYLFRTGG